MMLSLTETIVPGGVLGIIISLRADFNKNTECKLMYQILDCKTRLNWTHQFTDLTVTLKSDGIIKGGNSLSD